MLTLPMIAIVWGLAGGCRADHQVIEHRVAKHRHVQMRNLQTGQLAAQGFTNEVGFFQFRLPTGIYAVEVLGKGDTHRIVSTSEAIELHEWDRWIVGNRQLCVPDRAPTAWTTLRHRLFRLIIW